jgi:hypothetical protein
MACSTSHQFTPHKQQLCIARNHMCKFVAMRGAASVLLLCDAIVQWLGLRQTLMCLGSQSCMSSPQTRP